MGCCVNKVKLNKNFWAFIYLINENPEKYLNKRGKLIYEIGKNDLFVESVSQISKKLDIHLSVASKLVKSVREDLHIDIQKSKNKKRVFFDDDIVEKGLENAFMIMRK